MNWVGPGGAALCAWAQRELGYDFVTPGLLQQAVTHRSVGNNDPAERPDPPCAHNERLEFLGDAVLDLTVSHLLFASFPEAPEGLLSAWRSGLVDTQGLSTLAREVDLGSQLWMGRGEALSGGRDKPSILENALEAVLGAVYLDGGFAAAERVVERLFATRVAAIDPGFSGKDAKSRLQERLQGLSWPLPDYQVISVEGPAHAQWFTVNCQLARGVSGQGRGRSKRDAERAAAIQALQSLEYYLNLQEDEG
ncbi:MAG: ribonuclease III [Magnetococcus sp. WYHC-3]